MAECLFLPDEMAVYGLNRGYGNDSMCSYNPVSTILSIFVRKNSARSKLKSVRLLIESVAAAASQFAAVDLVHGSMSCRNLCVDSSCNLLVTDYPLSSSGCRRDDNYALLTVGIMLFLAGCQPQLFRRMAASHHDFSRSMGDTNRRNLISVAEFYGMDTLVRAIKQPDNDLSCDAVIHRLSETCCVRHFDRLPLLAEYVRFVFERIGRLYCRCGRVDLRRLPTIQQPTSIFKTCRFVGTVEDTLVRFNSEDFWGYADRKGRRLPIDRLLIWAGDFYEGRAVVRTSEGYGLIDREGRWVMPDTFNDMIWFGEANVVAALDDNCKWRLFNRQGRQVSELSCDSLSDCSEGIIVARQGNKYGYIAADGHRLTEFLYDEAYSFAEGKALVAIGRRRYYIDHTGHGLSQRQADNIVGCPKLPNKD